MRKNRWIIWIVILVILIVAGVGGYCFIKIKNTPRLRQAVFLTNGQVYFGYITNNPDSQVIHMKSVYYIKAQDLIQQTTDTSSDKKKIALVKLGNELHGPTDEIFISASQVLFFENMKQDSKISQAIDKNNQ